MALFIIVQRITNPSGYNHPKEESHHTSTICHENISCVNNTDANKKTVLYNDI
jgi:hypothetical protein